MSPAVRVPELSVTGRPDFRDDPRWDLDCGGGELGPDAAWMPSVAFGANPGTQWIGTSLWRCNRNHLGCRLLGRDGWQRLGRWLGKVVGADELYVAVVDGAGWVQTNDRRRYLQRHGAAGEYAWVRLDNGLRLVVADVDLTPKGGAPMRRVPRQEALERLGCWYIKAAVVRRQASKGWRPPKGANLARGRADRVGKARKMTGLDGDRLPDGMTPEEARAEMAAALEQLREAEAAKHAGAAFRADMPIRGTTTS